MTKEKKAREAAVFSCNYACGKQMGIQQALSRSSKTCPGHLHRDIGYRNQTKMETRGRGCFSAPKKSKM